MRTIFGLMLVLSIFLTSCGDGRKCTASYDEEYVIEAHSEIRPSLGMPNGISIDGHSAINISKEIQMVFVPREVKTRTICTKYDGTPV